MDSIDAVFANGRFYHFSNYNSFSPLLRYTDNEAYRDVSDLEVADTEFEAEIETPWLSFAGIQGFQRVYRLMVLGKNVDASVESQLMTVAAKYDFDDTETTLFSETVTPTTGGLIQLQHHLSQQKCESLKIIVKFKPSSSNTGRFRLTDLTLQVGVKPGYYKLPSSKRF